MKNISCFILLLFVAFGCDTKKENASVYDFVPENASIVLNISNIENLKSNINNNAFIKTISSTKLSQKIIKKLNYLNTIQTPNPIVISFLEDKNDSLQFILTTKQTKNLITKDTIKHKALYTVFKDSILIASTKKELLKTVSQTKNNTKDISKLIQTINTKKPISIILNNTKTNTIKTLLNTQTFNFKDFTDYTSLDIDVSQDNILLNGITTSKDSLKLINIFKNTTPQENQLAQIAPSNCDGFLSFTFDEFSKFKKNLNLFNGKINDSIPNTLYNNIIEVGIITQDSNKSIVLNSIDIIATKDALLNEKNKVETYRQIPIYIFSKPALFENTFYPLINYNKANFYCIIDQFLVFSNTVESLQNVIANYQNKTTLSTRKYYKNVSENLSSASSLLSVLNPTLLKDVLDTNFNEYIEHDFKPYRISALQFIYDNHYAHMHAVIKKNKAKAEIGAVTEMLNITLDNDILNTTQFVTNHRTKEKEIVVQDINNTLYLISNKGKILFKKQLHGAILGNVSQIDSYKNGKLQLAFATPHRVYVIDRTGKDLDNFPMKFNDKITQPLSVFDYDKNKKYRFLVTQGKHVLLYNAKGKTVKGFKFTAAKQAINSQPQHIRIGSKDYIIIKTENKLHILNRRGNTRIKTNAKFKYNNTPVYHYQNGFATLSKNGSLVQINQKGNITTSNLFGKNTAIIATKKTLVAQNDNKLKIKNNTLELDFGNYTTPKIFYIKNKLYISVTDLQAQKVLLFDSKAKLINNFPVYGNSTIQLDNIDKDNNLEFITKGDNNSILLYEIN